MADNKHAKANVLVTMISLEVAHHRMLRRPAARRILPRSVSALGAIAARRCAHARRRAPVLRAPPNATRQEAVRRRFLEQVLPSRRAGKATRHDRACPTAPASEPRP